MALRTVALVVSGLAAAGCGGPETMAEPQVEQAPHVKPSASEAIRAGLLLKNPKLEITQRPGDSETRSALLFNPYYHEVAYVCQVISGSEYCEDVQGFDDTYYDWNGTVGVYTLEREGDGSYFASFAGSSVSWDSATPQWVGGVMILWRHYTLSSVTSGSFFSQIHHVSNSNFYSDTVYIY